MSKIALTPNASGTGTLTIAAPNTNTDRTLTLPDQTGTILTGSGAIGINASAANNSLVIDASGNVTIAGNAALEGSKFQTQGAKTYSSGIPYNMVGVYDSTAMASGVGGAINFIGNYTSGGSATTFATIDSGKADGTSGNFGGNLIFKTRTNGSSCDERMRIDSSGTLLIGQTGNPATSSVVIKVPTGTANGVNAQITSNTGTSYPWSNYNASGTYVGGITCTSSATAFPTSSDIRLKKNIVDAPSALEEIKSARVISHEWIEEDTQPVEFGFIAQELIEVIPQAVIVGVDKEDGSIEIPWGVDYSKLVPLLTKAIQEQQTIITQLQADVAALKGAK